MIRFGIVGAGKIAHKFARDIRLVKNAELVGIASRDPFKALNFKEKYDLEVAYGSYLEMAKDPNIDAVYIATPHNFHLEQSMLFLKHQKHVLCEKPIAVNTKQFDTMVAVAKENQLLLMEAMWTKFLPSHVLIKELIEEKELGRLIHADLEMGYDLLQGYPKEGRLLNPILAGGSILDIGVYPISMMRSYTKEAITDVEAKAIMSDTGVDNSCVMDFTFADGSTAHLASYLDKPITGAGKLVFEHGTVMLEDFSRCERFTLNDEIYETPFLGEGFVHEITAFADTIMENQFENEVMPYESSRDALQIMDAVRKKIHLVYPFE